MPSAESSSWGLFACGTTARCCWMCRRAEQGTNAAVPWLFSEDWGLVFINTERLKNLIVWVGSGVTSGPRREQLLSARALHVTPGHSPDPYESGHSSCLSQLTPHHSHTVTFTPGSQSMQGAGQGPCSCLLLTFAGGGFPQSREVSPAVCCQPGAQRCSPSSPAEHRAGGAVVYLAAV